jgi:hypothetical protein
MGEDIRVTAATVRQLAEVAALPLAPEREATVAAVLDAWLPMANELSRKLSAAGHWTVTPITVFTHPAGGGGSPWR